MASFEMATEPLRSYAIFCLPFLPTFSTFMQTSACGIHSMDQGLHYKTSSTKQVGASDSPSRTGATEAKPDISATMVSGDSLTDMPLLLRSKPRMRIALILIPLQGIAKP